LAKFNKQMLADKAKMQKSLNKDLATIKKCIKKMQKSVRLGLLETEDESAEQSADGKINAHQIRWSRNASTRWKTQPNQKACKILEKISKKDLNRQKVLKNVNLTEERPNITTLTVW